MKIMDVTTKYRGNVLVVNLKGELDHHTAENLRKTVEHELDKEIAQHLLLNLSGLKFMDSSGLGVILGRYRRVSAQGGRVAACALHPHVARLYELAGLPKIIPVFDSEDDAIVELRQE